MGAAEVAWTIGAAVSTPMLAALLAHSGLRLRTRSYRRHEDGPLPLFASAWSDIGAEGSRQDAAYAAANAALKPLHEAVNRSQDRIVLHILNAAWLLFIAFVAASASLTLFAHNDIARLASAAVDATAFVLVLYHFRASARARSHWLRARSRVEFLRQWTVVAAPLLIIDEKAAVEEFEAQRALIDAGLPNANEQLLSDVESLGEKRLKDFAEHLKALDSVERAGALTYLKRRVLRQGQWFAASRARLLRSTEQRGARLLILFITAAAVAGIRFIGVVLLGWEENMLDHLFELLILFAIGATSCATAIYVNQNGRSLYHRYDQHLRDIRHWFETHRPFLERLKDANDPLTSASKERFIQALTSFERLMLMELLDWIRTSQSDAMELAPA